MPLYDFACADCGTVSTLLLKYEDPAACPACGGAPMTKRLAPCAFTGFTPRPAERAPTTPIAAAPKGHVHGPACGCGPVKAPCAAGSKADELIKKYLD